MKEIFELRESDNNKQSVQTPRALFAQAKKVNIDHEQENLIVFYLNARNHVKHVEVLFKGGINRTLIDSQTLFRRTLENNAVSIALAHNHPSGDLSPSEADIEVTYNLAKGAKILGLELVDHIIFDKTSFHSMKEGGLL
jgi:DNA repair protein RadC